MKRAVLVAAVWLGCWATAHSAALPAMSRALYAAAPSCVDDSTQASCKKYTYPDNQAVLDINNNCMFMPDMVGCTLRRMCTAGKLTSRYCKPMALLAILCADMPSMSPCKNYTALCKAGSVVEQCRQEAAPPSIPSTSAARSAILEACASHTMPSCESCHEGAGKCPDVLATYTAMCHEMGSMPQCAAFSSFCAANGDAFAPLCGSGGHQYLPSMKMYFHQRVAEIVLWRDWVPHSNGKYAGAVIAVMCFAVVSQALKVGRLLLEARWAAQLKPRPHPCGPSAVPAAAKSADESPASLAAWRRLLQERVMTSGQLRRSAVRSLFQGAASVLDYFNMLVVMTFNIGLFCAIVTGYMLGTLLFSHLLETRPSAPQPEPLPFMTTVTATQQQEEEENGGCCCSPANLEIGCGC